MIYSFRRGLAAYRNDSDRVRRLSGIEQPIKTEKGES